MTQIPIKIDFPNLFSEFGYPQLTIILSNLTQVKPCNLGILMLFFISNKRFLEIADRRSSSPTGTSVDRFHDKAWIIEKNKSGLS